jgi:hypothetical protein
MLWTIFGILLVLWALGMITATSMGGLIHPCSSSPSWSC